MGYHAGHFIPKSTCGIDLRYDERNIHGQCYHCNINLGGYGAMYHKKMVEKYGQSLVTKLWKIKNTVGTPWTEAQYLEKTEYYKKRLNDISQESVYQTIDD